jgi:hypothetical protein
MRLLIFFRTIAGMPNPKRPNSPAPLRSMYQQPPLARLQRRNHGILSFLLSIRQSGLFLHFSILRLKTGFLSPPISSIARSYSFQQLLLGISGHVCLSRAIHHE